MMIGRFMISFNKYYNYITNALYRFDPHTCTGRFFIFPHHSHMFGLVAYRLQTAAVPSPGAQSQVTFFYRYNNTSKTSFVYRCCLDPSCSGPL